MLLILDGWGLGAEPEVDAIRQADTPHMDGYMASWPCSSLVTYGEAVGLPAGQMGNSEVGHLNIGAGRVVYQDLLRIDRAVADGSLRGHPELRGLFDRVKSTSGRLHLMGLCSDGGVHSHLSHIIALARYASEAGVPKVFIHAFLDGRDTDPRGGVAYLETLQEALEGLGVRLATVIGRYYAMDRDKRWERTRRAYELLVKGEGREVADAVDAVRGMYAEGITDEFMEPMVLDREGLMRAGDGVLFANFRTDRPRQLTEVLTQVDKPEHGMHRLSLDYLTMSRYDSSFRHIRVIYDKEDLRKTLGEVISGAGLRQLRAAETEKYPHVTFFFNGGREEPFQGEERVLIPSPKVATYDLQPEMSAPALNRAVMDRLRLDAPDFVCVNFANADMVGHTGVFAAAVRAAEAVDACLGQLVPLALGLGYRLMIIADHGNSDYMVNPDGSPNTAHTVNPVPCVVLGEGLDRGRARLDDGRLADVAPTLLWMMGLPVPEDMTGRVLVNRR